jgi:hypothetical protein
MWLYKKSINVSLHGRKGLGKKIQKNSQHYVMVLVHLKKFGP